MRKNLIILQDLVIQHLNYAKRGDTNKSDPRTSVATTRDFTVVTHHDTVIAKCYRDGKVRLYPYPSNCTVARLNAVLGAMGKPNHASIKQGKVMLDNKPMEKGVML